MKAAIEVHNLVYRYGNRVAVKGISFTVPPGLIFGLLGPNGGGKSTTFRVLATMSRPHEGSAVVAGFDVVRAPDEVRRRLGIVFQHPALDRKLTVFENLYHHGHLYGLRGSELRRRIEQALERVALKDRADELVERLSGGLQRRVEIAKALMHEPEVLLLDEPTTGLDPAARAALWEELRRARQERGCTILMTTHLFDDAEQCDLLGILDEGQLVAHGTPTELKEAVGGQVLTVETDEPQALAELVRQLVPEAQVSFVDHAVRLEHPEAHRFVPIIAERAGEMAKQIHLGRPTLADAFFKFTGHRFDEAAA